MELQVNQHCLQTQNADVPINRTLLGNYEQFLSINKHFVLDELNKS